MAHPRKYDESDLVIEQLRQLFLTLGAVVEKEAGRMHFSRDRWLDIRHDRQRPSERSSAIWIKAPTMVQEIVINSDRDKFFKPPYLVVKGWVGVRLNDSSDWDELAVLLTDGYRLSAVNKSRGGGNP